MQSPPNHLTGSNVPTAKRLAITAIKNAPPAKVPAIYSSACGIQPQSKRATFSGLFLLQHHFCGFDYRRNCVANLQLHFFRAPPGYHAFDKIFAHANHYMSHHSTKLKFFNFPVKTIPR
jgi:hypothetical protein